MLLILIIISRREIIIKIEKFNDYLVYINFGAIISILASEYSLFFANFCLVRITLSITNMSHKSVNLKDGRRYSGFVVGGLPHGKGILIEVNGDKFMGFFDKGEQKWGSLVCTDGNIFIGTFVNGCLTHGRSKHPNGSSYEGYFENGERHGYGIGRLIDGTEIKGRWENGIPIGQIGYRYKDLKISSVFISNCEVIIRNIKSDDGAVYLCSHCDKTSSVKLKTCSKCKTVSYCNSECQKKHWDATHKEQCDSRCFET